MKGGKAVWRRYKLGGGIMVVGGRGHAFGRGGGGGIYSYS